MTKAGGGQLDYVVTFLEMDERPAHPRPHLPPGPPAALIAAENPPVWYFRGLYDTVGRGYNWADVHAWSQAEIVAYLADPAVTLYTFLRGGWPHGFFVLDAREAGTCNLAYFGLVPEALGQGLGRFLLETAVHLAWDRPGTRHVTVNTCSLDHPRALPLYQRAGFEPVRREARSRPIRSDPDPADA